MNTFLVLFTCAENSPQHLAWQKLDSETQKDRFQKGTLAKQEWAAKYQNQIVFEGGSLSDKTTRVDLKGLHEVASMMGSFLVVKASSREEAASMFVDHPHFAHFPGDAVEILERVDTERG